MDSQPGDRVLVSAAACDRLALSVGVDEYQLALCVGRLALALGLGTDVQTSESGSLRGSAKHIAHAVVRVVVGNLQDGPAVGQVADGSVGHQRVNAVARHAQQSNGIAWYGGRDDRRPAERGVAVVRFRVGRRGDESDAGAGGECGEERAEHAGAKRSRHGATPFVAREHDVKARRARARGQGGEGGLDGARAVSQDGGEER